MNNWRTAYEQTCAGFPSLAADSRLTLLGFSIAVDAIHRLGADELAAIDTTAGGSGPAAELCRRILAAAAAGEDREILPQWAEGSQWLLGRLPAAFRVGGNAGQAANVLSALGARSLLAVTRRSARQLSLLGEQVLVAEPHGQLVSASEARIRDELDAAPYHFLEFQADTPLPGGGLVPRSGRIVVRFDHRGLAQDEYFARAAQQLAPDAGAGLVSGLSKLTPAQFGPAIEWVAHHAGVWRDSGLPSLHLELAHYPQRGYLARMLDALRPYLTSLGMNEAELGELTGGVNGPAERAAEVAQRYQLNRVTVHADRWALTVTRGDPSFEQSVLLTAALVAGARAAAGEPVSPDGLPKGAQLLDSDELPAVGTHDQWRGVVVPTLWQRRPTGTIGLGDTFCAATLLALGSKRSPELD